MSTTAQDSQVGAARGAAPRAPLGGVIAGAVLVAAGLALLPEALDGVETDETFVGGPRLAPIVVSVGWLVLAVCYLVQQVVSWRSAQARGGDEATTTATAEADGAGADQVDGADRADEAVGGRRWLTPVLLMAALLAYALLLEWLGFVLTTAAFFIATARILRSTHLRRDIAVAVPLALGIYLGFTRLLDIHLPEGVLPL